MVTKFERIADVLISMIFVAVLGAFVCILFGTFGKLFATTLPDSPNAHYESSSSGDYSPYNGSVQE